MYGDKKTEIGGKALKYHASIRLDIQRSGFITLKKDGEPIGIDTAVKSVKNKVMPPYKKTIVPIIFGEGIDYARALFQALKEKNKIKSSGKSYTLNYFMKDEKVSLSSGNGQEDFMKKLRELVEDNPRARRAIERKIQPKVEE
jgi:recombination protein RecA